MFLRAVCPKSEFVRERTFDQVLLVLSPAACPVLKRVHRKDGLQWLRLRSAVQAHNWTEVLVKIEHREACAPRSMSCVRGKRQDSDSK
jgi:hypothetical protein